MRDYKKFSVWSKSHDLVIMLYKQIVPGLPATEQFGLTSQLKRAAYSIPLNIVEGCGRNSERDFAHFLDITLGSVQELEYCFLLLKDLNYLSEDHYLLLNEKVNEVKAMIINLIKTVRHKSNER